ncbi:MAG: dihydropteroate synthase, partial [Candidatus Dormibacteraeota bacterium]|nr:dihydropteroate synthase [Candidatus Dormibacteraeota bacterium]
MIPSQQAPYPLRLLDPGPWPRGAPGRLLVITEERAPWCAAAVAAGVECSSDSRGVLLRGEPAALGALARLLDGAGGAAELAMASPLLGRRGSSLALGRHRWRLGGRTRVLGVINTTPDSFSGDGVGRSVDLALDRAAAMVRDGADAIDVGGESSRPGHSPVSPDEEIERVVPAIARIAAELAVPVFVDTWKAPVAEEALKAGASCVNDIWGLRRDPELAAVVARHEAAVVLMHNQLGAEYRDVLGEVLGGLAESLRLARSASIPLARIILDPGIGFGKTPAQSLAVLA